MIPILRININKKNVVSVCQGFQGGGGLTEADIDFQGVALIVKFYSVAMNQLLAFLISKRSPKVLFSFQLS